LLCFPYASRSRGGQRREKKRTCTCVKRGKGDSRFADNGSHDHLLWIQNSCIAQGVPGYSRKLRVGAPLFCYGIAMPRKHSWLTWAAVCAVVLSSACNCHAFQPAAPGGCMAARRGPDPASVAHPIRYPSAFLNCS